MAISVDALGKRYRIAHERDPYGRLTESLARALRAPFDRMRGKPRETMEWIWALQDVSFQVRHGDVVGVIGRNGAGKSTLLKVLSRITEPTTGSADLRGRVGSVLEVGTGFHQELTGRENIFMSGAVLGMTRSDISLRFDDIVDFAGIEKFLDTPVKRYSSGMQVRLGFAVAAHLDPEILLVDEVLAVGDASFQRKSLGRMHDAAKAGRTVVFVSHDLGAVSNLTSKCLYLEGGRVRQFGPTREVVQTYLSDSLVGDEPSGHELSFYRRSSVSETPVIIDGISCGSGVEGRPSLGIGDPFTIDISFLAFKRIEAVTVTAILKDGRGHSVAVLYSPDSGFTLTSAAGPTSVQVKVPDLPLAPGTYYVDIGVNQSPGTEACDVILDFPLFDVINSGQVVQWLDRPWGTLHPRGVSWGRPQ